MYCDFGRFVWGTGRQIPCSVDVCGGCDRISFGHSGREFLRPAVFSPATGLLWASIPFGVLVLQWGSDTARWNPFPTLHTVMDARPSPIAHVRCSSNYIFLHGEIFTCQCPVWTTANLVLLLQFLALCAPWPSWFVCNIGELLWLPSSRLCFIS